MSSPSPIKFPSPVGGVPLPIDFAPSILFSILFGLAIPLVIWRVANPRTRNIVLVGTIPFVLEHLVNFALRAHASHNEGFRLNTRLEAYFQGALGAGFLSIGQDLTNLTRSFLVHSSISTNVLQAHKNASPAGRSQSTPQSNSTIEAMMKRSMNQDYPRVRYVVRWACTIITFALLASIIISAIAGIEYQGAAESGKHAGLVYRLRYVSSALALVMLTCLVLVIGWAYFTVPYLPRAPLAVIVGVAFLLSISAIYRLVVMHFETTSLTSMAPGSLNSAGSKASFYVLHVVPEFLAAVTLMSLDTRHMFATGTWGDMGWGEQVHPSNWGQ